MTALATRRRVEFRDTDAAGIVHFSAFFLWMESAEHELLRQAGIRVVERSEVAPQGADSVASPVVSWPRVSVSCDYIGAVRFGDEVDIAVTVADIGRTSVTYAFAFSAAGRPVATGRVVAVRCRMQPEQFQQSGQLQQPEQSPQPGRPEPVPIPADIRERLMAFRPDASGANAGAGGA